MDRENPEYYGNFAVAPNLPRRGGVVAATLCLLLAACAAPLSGLANESGTQDWDCAPLDPLRGALGTTPCFRATLSDHNLITLQWRVRNSRGLVYLSDALGPDYSDPGYRTARCEGEVADGCRMTMRVNSGGFYRWRIHVTAPTGEQLFATAPLTVPKPFPPRLAGGGALDALAPQPAPVTWQTDPRNAPHDASLRSAWVGVNDPRSGRWPTNERWPRSGPDALYPLAADMLDDAGELSVQARDCRSIGSTRTKLCSDPAREGYYTSGDRFLEPNPLYLDSDAARTLAFTTRSGQVRELTSSTLLPAGPVRTSAGEYTLPAAGITPGEHHIELRSCAREQCTEPHALRIIVDGDVDWEIGRDYERDFLPAVGHNLLGTGLPLDILWSARGDIWLTREFSNGLDHVDAGGNAHLYEVPSRRQGSFASARSRLSKPFGFNMGGEVRASSSVSSLSEKVIEADGKLWFTQGGDLDTGKVRDGGNYSRIVSFDPAATDLPTTEQDDRFCVYPAPSAPDADRGDNHILGIAAAGERMWVAELRGLYSERPAAISAFMPGAVNCANDLNYRDPDAVAAVMPYCDHGATARQGCMESWPLDAAKPAMLEYDPADGTFWFTDTNGVYLGNFDPARETPVSLYPLARTSRFAWSIRVDDDAVYFASYGTRTLFRFDKRSQSMHEIAIPHATTKAALLHSIALDRRERRLWFTLTNEGVVAHDFTASTIGYIDLDGWQAVSAGQDTKVRGVLYAGLERTPYPEREPLIHQSFAGIAVHPTSGRIVISTMLRNQVTELTPRPGFYAAD